MRPKRILAAAIALTFVACKSTEEPEDSEVSRWAALAFGSTNVAWSVDERSPYALLRPAIDDQRVYVERGPILTNDVVTDAAKLIALDRASGAERWRQSIVAGVNSEIAGDAIGTIWGSLRVFDRSTGVQRYSYQYSPTVSLSSNVVTDGATFFVVSEHHHVVAVDAISGLPLWDVLAVGGGQFGGGNVTLAGNALIVSTRYRASITTEVDSMIVMSLNKTTGALNWHVSMPSDLVSRYYVTDPPVVAAGNVFVLISNHRLKALSLATGDEQWQVDVTYGPNAMLNGGLAACDGRIIAGTGDLGLVSINATTGAEQWKIPDIHQGGLRELTCSYGTVIAFGSVRMFDAATGRPLVTYPLSTICCEGQFYIYGAARDENWIYFATTYGYAKVKAPAL